MTNETASNGRPKEYTELAKLRPSKSVSIFGYVKEAVYAFNKDHHGKPQHEHCLSLVDSKTQRPVLFSLFRDKDDEKFRGHLREGMLVRVHRATCRKTADGMWLFGKAGVAGMHVVAFQLQNVLNVVCTTSSEFSFTQLHHDRLNELQRHFLQRSTATEPASDVFAPRIRPIARLVKDETFAPSVTYAIESLEAHSPPPVVIKVEDDEPVPTENAAASVGRKPAKRLPVVIELDDDEQESEENAAAVDIKPIKPALNPVEGQFSEFVAARRSGTQFAEVISNSQSRPTASPFSRSLPSALKRPQPVEIKFVDGDRESEQGAAAVDIKPSRPARNGASEFAAARCSSTQFAEAVRIPQIQGSNTQFADAIVDSQARPTSSPFSRSLPSAPKRPRVERPYVASPPVQFSKHCQTLRGAQQRTYFDCICEVIGVLDNGDHVILRVWDGTKPSRSLARCHQATPITLDSDLEASVGDYVVDIVCWDEHAESAKGLEPLDKVGIVNVHAFVNRSGVEAYTMHGGVRFGREIRLLKSLQLVEQLERQLSSSGCRPSTQSQDSDDAEFADDASYRR